MIQQTFQNILNQEKLIRSCKISHKVVVDPTSFFKNPTKIFWKAFFKTKQKKEQKYGMVVKEQDWGMEKGSPSPDRFRNAWYKY
ncbi:MAG: hypothetical protein CM15mP106_7730 [Candidatus Neomarinimicrobiota bacterium]|nr:MAG: hypothetical protein CM15mP106_7730 [Candidatus Neomarinimicrobiota bacterium]